MPDTPVPVDGFTYGWLTPVLAYLMAGLGGALGLRCALRALTLDPTRRTGWLLLSAVAIGTGVFTMHFIAMLGFTAQGFQITYDLPVTFGSLLVAIVVVGIGVFIVGRKGRTPAALLSGGTITGLGVACMHYMGMASMRMPGHLSYDSEVVALSIAIAVVAATAALWFAMTIKGFGAALGAAAIMGVAVSGMHYTAMEAVSVFAHHHEEGAGGRSSAEILMPILAGPVLLLLLVGLFVGFDPLEHQERRTTDEEEAASKPGNATQSLFEPRA